METTEELLARIEGMKRTIAEYGLTVYIDDSLPLSVTAQFLAEVLACPCCCPVGEDK